MNRKQLGFWFIASCFIAGGFGAFLNLYSGVDSVIAVFYWGVYLNFCALVWALIDYINKEIGK